MRKRKVIVVFLLLILMFGCENNELKPISLNVQYDNDVVMIKDGYEYTIGSDVIEFLNTLTLLETDETSGMQACQLLLDKEMLVYTNLVLEYDNEFYKIQNNVSEEYYWMVFNSEIISINEITDKYKFDKIIINGVGDYELEVHLKDNAKQWFLDNLSKLTILEYGIVERGAGIGVYNILFDGALIEEGNGVYVYIGDELVTNKQSDILNGSIQSLINELLPEEIETLQTFENDNVIVKKVK